MNPAARRIRFSAPTRGVLLLAAHLCSSMVFALPALGYSTGVATASGKQVLTCNACHYDGLPGQVRFEGPAEVRAGTAATFRFVVVTQTEDQPLAGFNVAASAGRLDIAPETGGHVDVSELNPSAEITHSYPQVVDINLEAAWEFTWTAPETTGSEVLYGAGNTVNGNGEPTGDRGAATTWVVTVIDANATPRPTPTPTPTMTPCRGDCRHDGAVTVDELVMGVNIALQRAPLAACSGLDANGDLHVTVDELVAAIANAVGGCR